LRRSAPTNRRERPHRLDGELEAALALAALSVVGALLGSLPLSLVGALGALGALIAWSLMNSAHAPDWVAYIVCIAVSAVVCPTARCRIWPP